MSTTAHTASPASNPPSPTRCESGSAATAPCKTPKRGPASFGRGNQRATCRPPILMPAPPTPRPIVGETFDVVVATGGQAATSSRLDPTAARRSDHSKRPH